MRIQSRSSQIVGGNLRKVRLQKGLMQMDVAVATNLDRTYISRIETGKARVTCDLLCLLVNSLEIKSSELLVGY